MKSQIAKCPGCGANIKLTGVTGKAISCDYCNATILLSDLPDPVRQDDDQPIEGKRPEYTMTPSAPVNNAIRLKYACSAISIFIVAVLPLIFLTEKKPPISRTQSLSEMAINYEIDKIQEQGLGVTAKKVSGTLGKIKVKLFPSKQKALTTEKKKEIYFKLVSPKNRSIPEADMIETLCKEYGIPQKQLKAISKEGKKEGWPTE